jgi:hypothetical protein
MLSENTAKVQELKSKHGASIEIVELDDVEFVVRPPSYPDFLRFIDETQGGDTQRSVALTNFVFPCVVYPDDARQIIEAKPSYLTKLSIELQSMAGGSAKAKRKKL